MTTRKTSVLGIQGSPRKNGNTNTLLDSILDTVQTSGIQTEKIHLQDLNLSPCRACDSCRKTGICIQKDDMQMLLEKMKISELWIIGTPVYWWSVTAQTKIFIDRWYAFDRTIFKGKPVVVIVPLGSSNMNTAMYVTGMFDDIFDYLGIEMFDKLVATGVYKRGDVENRADYLNEAEKIGKRIIDYLS